MINVEYTATDNVQVGHTASTVYNLGFKTRRDNRIVTKVGPTQKSLSGAQVSIVHRRDVIHDLETTIHVQYGVSNIDHMLEFLDSVVDGAEFQIDFDASQNLIGAGSDFENGQFNNWPSPSGETIITIDQPFATKAYDLGATSSVRLHGVYIPVTSGETINLSVFSNTESSATEAQLRLYEYNSSFGFVASHTVATLAAGEPWEEISGSATLGGTAAYVLPAAGSVDTHFTNFRVWREGTQLNAVLDGNTYTPNRISTLEQFRYSFKVRLI